MNILQSRKADNRKARFSELRGRPQDMAYAEMADFINRSFEAGVAAHSDHIEASRQMMLAKYREQPEPVAIMDVEPGNLIRMTREDFLNSEYREGKA